MHPAARRGPAADLSTWPGRPRRRARPDLAAATDRPFDLASGPLLRAALFRLGADDHVLALTLHHIVTDGWSSGVLVGDLAALYRAARRRRAGRAARAARAVRRLRRLAARPARRRRRWTRSSLLAAARWPACPPLELPTDRPRPAVHTIDGAVARFTRPRRARRRGCAELAGGRTARCSWPCSPRCTALLHRFAARTTSPSAPSSSGRDRAELDASSGSSSTPWCCAPRSTGDRRSPSSWAGCGRPRWPLRPPGRAVRTAGGGAVARTATRAGPRCSRPWSCCRTRPTGAPTLPGLRPRTVEPAGGRRRAST